MKFALVRALRENWIAGAALDVYEKEPLPADSPLRDPGHCRPLPPDAALRQRGPDHTVGHRSEQGYGRTLRSGPDRRPRIQLWRRYYKNAVRREQRGIWQVLRRFPPASLPFGAARIDCRLPYSKDPMKRFV